MGLHYTYQPAPSRASSARRTPAFLQHNDSIVRYDISVKLPNYKRALSCLAFVLQMVQCVSHGFKEHTYTLMQSNKTSANTEEVNRFYEHNYCFHFLQRFIGCTPSIGDWSN